MIILDENFPESQRRLLRSWRISVQQVGVDVGYSGMKDDAIIPLLHHLRQPTFFSLDPDFYKRVLCHKNYCIAYLSVVDYEAAVYVRKLLRHSQFNTKASRMGTVIKASHDGLTIWRLHAEKSVGLGWG